MGRNQKKNGMFFNQKTVIEGEKFDSRTEALRYQHLQKMQEHSLIQNLKRQVEYELIPRQFSSSGKLLFRECHYISDFEYDVLVDGTMKHKAGDHVVEDVKSNYTEKMEDFRIKRKLMFWVHGIYVEVVKSW